MTNIPHIIHQGDVLMIEAKLSKSAQPVALTKSPDGRQEAVLALGETSGHRHTIISDRIARFRDDGAGYGPGVSMLRLDQPARIEHLHGAAHTGEHRSIPLRATSYAVIDQSQWSDDNEPIAVED